MSTIRERAEQVVNEYAPEHSDRERMVSLVERMLLEGAVRGVEGDVPVHHPELPKKGPKNPSRPQRWAAGIAKAQDGLSTLRDGLDELENIRQEYESTRDNVPENLQSSPYYEKLDEVSNIDFDSLDLDGIESVISDAEGVDLPKGFGRD